MISYFLMNEDALKLIDGGLSNHDFRYISEGYRTVSEKFPEALVAYDEQRIRELYKRVGLEIVEPIHYGSWCGRKNSTGHQDVVIAIKR